MNLINLKLINGNVSGIKLVFLDKPFVLIFELLPCCWDNLTEIAVYRQYTCTVYPPIDGFCWWLVGDVCDFPRAILQCSRKTNMN